jgi:hypothetical protein
MSLLKQRMGLVVAGGLVAFLVAGGSALALPASADSTPPTSTRSTVDGMKIGQLIAGGDAKGDAIQLNGTRKTPDSPFPTIPTANPPGTPRVASWQLLSTSADGRQLTIAVLLGGTCEEIEYVSVAESATSVSIAPVLRTGLYGACADSLVLERGTIELKAPLDARALLHGTELP